MSVRLTGLILTWFGIVAVVQAVPLPTLPKPGVGEWPCWRGPERNGLCQETGLLREWPARGPKLLWKCEGLGQGYSAPSLAGGKLFITGTEEKQEILLAYDAQSGNQLWKIPIGSIFGATGTRYQGARSTPTVEGNLVFALGSDGRLICAETSRGTLKWAKDLKADFEGKNGAWGYAESPLVDRDQVVCTPGGSKATLVALHKKTGEVIWKAAIPAAMPGKPGVYNAAGYASLVVSEIEGVRQYIQFLAGGVVGVSAKDGTLLWTYDHPASRTANCFTPIVRAGSVFAASAYGIGGGTAQIRRTGNTFKTNELYFVKELQNHHGGMVLVGDHLYGTGASKLYCVDFKTGKVVWENAGVGKGSILYADGYLYVRSEKGVIALVEATPTAYREKGRFLQPMRSAQGTWAHPVIAGGRLYLRDWDVLYCYDVKGN